MGQALLFSEAEIAATPPPRTFVFERMDAEALFEATTALFLDVFIESQLWRDGYAGTDAERAKLVEDLKAKILARFIDDPEFAARIGNSEDCREDVADTIRTLRAELKR